MSTLLLENILNQAEALEKVSNYQNGEGRSALGRAAEILRSSKRIVLTGMGASLFACIAFQHMLSRQNLDVTCLETAELLYFRPPWLDKDTTVVLVSRSGESIEALRLLESLHDLGIPVIGVVNVKESTLATQASNTIMIGSPADQLVAIQTYTATLAVFALLSAVLLGDLPLAQVQLATTIKILGRETPVWVKERAQLHSFVRGSSPLYLLGRGGSLGAISEGVLLMHEVAKASAVGMSVPQFRHGPVEVVDANFRAIVIVTQTETAGLDTVFARDVVELGGQARCLGPSVPGSDLQALCSWPLDIPILFTSIFETIPLQIVAYSKAELDGIRPGDFRWAPAITNSETGFLSTV